jgi:hypothetical protein
VGAMSAAIRASFAQTSQLQSAELDDPCGLRDMISSEPLASAGAADEFRHYQKAEQIGALGVVEFFVLCHFDVIRWGSALAR